MENKKKMKKTTLMGNVMCCIGLSTVNTPVENEFLKKISIIKQTYIQNRKKIKHDFHF